VSVPWIVAFAVLWLVMLTTTVVVLGTLRRIGPLVELAHSIVERGGVDLAGLPVGSVVPPFEGRDATGSVVTSAELLEDGAILLFLSAGCRPCHDIAVDLEAIGDAIGGITLAVVVAEGTDPSALGLGPSIRLLFQRDREISRALRNLATPQAFLIDRNAVVLAANIPHSIAQIQDLVDRAKGGDDSEAAAYAVKARSVVSINN